MTAFSRQIHEAVVIQKNEKNSILNSKGEYNRCTLPRLSVMVGVKEMKENEEGVTMTDQEIEDEILRMRNRKRKEIVEKVDAGKPAKKRRRRWKKEIQQKRAREESSLEGENEIQEEEKPSKRMKTQCARVRKNKSEEEKIFEDRKKEISKKTKKENPSKLEENILHHSEVRNGEALRELNEKIGTVHNIDQQSGKNCKIQKKKSQVQKNDEDNFESKNTHSYFPIFEFTAVRQMGRGEATSKVKPSCTQRNLSNTHHKPKKKVKVPPYKYKTMSEHFLKIEQKAQINNQLGAIIRLPEDHPT